MTIHTRSPPQKPLTLGTAKLQQLEKSPREGPAKPQKPFCSYCSNQWRPF